MRNCGNGEISLDLLVVYAMSEMLLKSPFLFTVCQVGAEPALKREMARDCPELRFAYSRPGFVTFKFQSEEGGPGPDFALQSVFARACGVSIGKKDFKGLLDLGEKLLQAETEVSRAWAKPRLALHVWERDRHLPGDEPPGVVQGRTSAARALRERLLAEAPGIFAQSERPEAGQLVFDVILIEENESWAGFHRHGPSHLPFAGGRPDVSVPAAAPSRAYLKLEEGVILNELPLKRGDRAIEIGSAPGGASYALLKRGVDVLGIDPGEMSPAVLDFSENQARFEHLRKSVSAVKPDELPAEIDWLLLDMNVEPRISLAAVERLSGWYRDSLKGLLLTVKLNDWKFADEIPRILRQVQAMGMRHVRARQLPGNRQEICVCGLSARGRRGQS